MDEGDESLIGRGLLKLPLEGIGHDMADIFNVPDPFLALTLLP